MCCTWEPVLRSSDQSIDSSNRPPLGCSTLVIDGRFRCGVVAVGFGLPMQGVEKVVHQREDDVEVALLHQVAAVVQFVQAPHLADPGQAGDEVTVGQVLAGVEYLVAQITEDYAAGEQRSDVFIPVFEQPPGGKGKAQAVHHDQPGREQDYPPVPHAVVGHGAGGEETVVVAGMARIEHLRKGPFAVPELFVHGIDAEVEEHQRQRYGQPLQGLHLIQRPPEESDANRAIEQHESAVQPRVIKTVDTGPVAGAKCLSGLDHSGFLLLLLLAGD
jgi:hypothetical protein